VYDIDKYTKVYGGGRCRSNASIKGNWIISDYVNYKFEYGKFEFRSNNLKNRLATREKEKAILQKELDKERNFQKEYKHNVEN